MFSKFKKAYISIEVVILASIVIIGGMCGLSAFLKNGQNAQSQSAEAMNNVIDMIGEEFDFNIGSGELPGGSNLPDDDTPEGMNEYGFYYGTYKFEGIIDPASSEDDYDIYGSYDFTIGEDGSITIGLVAEFQRIRYETNSADDVEFSLDGTRYRALFGSLLGGGSSEYIYLTLSNPENYTKNEYGFYFDAEYKGTGPSGDSVTFVWHANGNQDMIVIAPIPAGYATFENKTIKVAGSTYGTFSEDGTIFVDNSGVEYTLIK